MWRQVKLLWSFLQVKTVNQYHLCSMLQLFSIYIVEDSSAELCDTKKNSFRKTSQPPKDKVLLQGPMYYIHYFAFAVYHWWLQLGVATQKYKLIYTVNLNSCCCNTNDTYLFHSYFQWKMSLNEPNCHYFRKVPILCFFLKYPDDHKIFSNTDVKTIKERA